MRILSVIGGWSLVPGHQCLVLGAWPGAASLLRRKLGVMGVVRFEDLRVWQAARALCDELKPVLERPAFRRHLRLREQIGDAIASVMANIAEGFLRRNRKEFAQFVRIAAGSNGELRSHLYVAEARGCISGTECANLVAHTNSIGRMLTRLLQSLQRLPSTSTQRPGTNHQ